MRPKNLLFAAFLLLLASTRMFAGDPPATLKVNLSQSTVAEMKAKYGDNLTVEGTIDLSVDAPVVFAQAANPCAEFPEFGLCGPVAAEARRAAVDYANACCCDVRYGYECCDPSGGAVMSVLALASPTHCN